jgi:hypothetical protein
LALDFPLIFSSISLIQSFLNIFEKHSNANSKTTTKVAKSVSLNLQRLLNLADALNILPWCLQTCRSIEETAQNKIQFLFFFVNYIRTKVIGIIQKHRKVAEVRYTRLAVEMSPTTNSLFRGLFKQKVSRFVLGIFSMSQVTFFPFFIFGAVQNQISYNGKREMCTIRENVFCFVLFYCTCALTKDRS